MPACTCSAPAKKQGPSLYLLREDRAQQLDIKQRIFYKESPGSTGTFLFCYSPPPNFSFTNERSARSICIGNSPILTTAFLPRSSSTCPTCKFFFIFTWSPTFICPFTSSYFDSICFCFLLVVFCSF